jgi:hypothetical protein
MKVCTVTNDKGLALIVKRVDPGEYYGRNECLKATEALIEFYDTRHSNHGPIGQFISRYYLSTLADRDPYQGINLYGGEPAWQIDDGTLREALFNLAGLVPDFIDKNFRPMTAEIKL